MSTRTFRIDLSREVDGDGHYRGELYEGTTLRKVAFHEDRDACRAKLTAWADATVRQEAGGFDSEPYTPAPEPDEHSQSERV